MQAVCEAIAAQHKEGRLFGPLLILTWRRLRQAGVKVLALAASYAAGSLPWRPRPLRPYRPRPKAPEAAPTQAAAPPAAKRRSRSGYEPPELRPIPGLYEPPPPHLRARWFFPPRRARFKPA